MQLSTAVLALPVQTRRPPTDRLAVMPAKAKSPGTCKAKDRAIGLQNRGLALSQRADFLLVCQALKHYPEQVASLKTKLMDVGIILPSGDIRIPESEKVEQERATEAKADDDTALDSDGLPRAGLVVHRNFCTSWTSVPPKTLRVLIGVLEPVSLSKYALKACIPKGCKELPRPRVGDPAVLVRVESDGQGHIQRLVARHCGVVGRQESPLRPSRS